MYDGVSRPHHLDARMQSLTKRTQVRAVVRTPSAVVLRRTEQKRCHIAMTLDKDIVNIIEQCRLLLAFGTLSPDIVEENGKRTYAEVVHLFEFCHQMLTVLIVPLDVESRMDGPVKMHTTKFGTLVELLDTCSLFVGIRLAPVGTVVGIILRTVDIYIHLMASIEVQLAQPMLMAPGTSVKTLDAAAERHVRPVRNPAHLKSPFRHHLLQGLHTIIESTGISSHNDSTFRSHL